MGSSSSRPAASAPCHVQSQKQSPGKKKRKENVLVPFLRSMSCGASSSSWRTESFVQESRMQAGDLACQNTSKNSMVADLCDESCAPYGLHGSVGERHDYETSGGSSSGHISTTFRQNSEHLNVSKTGKSTASSLGSDCSASVVPNASYPLLSQRSRNGQCHQADSQAKNIQISHRRLSSLTDTNDSIASTDTVSCSGANSSNTSAELVVCEDNEINVLGSLASSSRIPGASVDFPDLGNSPNPGAIEEIPGPPQGAANLGSEESAARDSLQDTSDANRSENIGTLHVEGLGLVAQTLDESSSSSRGEASGREARRNNRRRLWDALTRATTRRRRFSPTFLLASEDIDGLGSWNDGWGLFDWNSGDAGSFVEEGGFLMRRSSEVDERRWRSRPQVWALQHFSNAMEGSSGHSRHCAFGRHPDGRCSCEAFVMTDETSTRASISRIVMLAEALFEVLDEIHRQSVALSRSTPFSLVSLPAPEAVVDSFPVRIHDKTGKAENVLDECAECYICLIEYEEGDCVRTLPCYHEFHMSCVDKWLKEVHRVCPLCRGNVCDETVQSSQAPA